MIGGKKVGLLILCVAVPSMVFYSLLVFFYTQATLEVTVLLAVLAVLGVLSWIGYGMLTEPPPPEADPTIELDDVRAETIHPERGAMTTDEFATGASPKFSTINECQIGPGTIVRDQVNLYRCRIGRDCKIESFVYIEQDVLIGDNCKIKPNVFIPTGVTIEDNVFIGPNVTFTNDKYPRVEGDWRIFETTICRGASIGAHAVILPGVRIGSGAIVGAGSVVTKDIPDNAVAYGNPARSITKISEVEN